jgi:hypothetical protein
VLKICKEAAVMSVLMQVFTISCQNRGHINVILVLQSCTDSLQFLPSSSSETFPTSSDGARNFSNIEVEEDVDVKGDGFIAISEELHVGIKQEDIPEDENLPDVTSETYEVSYVCMYLIRHILPLSRNITCNFSNISVEEDVVDEVS